MASSVSCRVHPVALMAMVDAHERRSNKEGQNDKAIGTLLGFYDKGGIQVTDCYSVKFSEANNEPSLDTSINEAMHDWMRQASPSEYAVGWFCTVAELDENSIGYHKYYSEFVQSRRGVREQTPVVLLTLDTSFKNGRLGIKAYLYAQGGIPGEPNAHCQVFNPIGVRVSCFETEQTALDLVAAATHERRRTTQLADSLTNLRRAADQLVGWVDALLRYVDDVIAGKREGDAVVGRQLMELVNRMQVQPKHFDTMINASSRDYLMVSYLSELAKSQLGLNEKIIGL